MSDRRGHTLRFRSSSAWQRIVVIFSVVALFSGLTAAEATGAAAGTAAAATAPTVPAPANATAYQIDPAHDGRQVDPAFGAQQQVKLWSKDFGGTVQYPLIVGSRIFVDAENSSGVGSYIGTNVSAYDSRDGSRLWGPINIGGLGSFGTLTYDNGTVFALNYDGQLFAFDAATGRQKWSVQMPWQWVFTSPPTAVNGVVYVSGAGLAGTLYAVSEATGAVQWAALVQNGDHSSPAVDSTGIYVSYACEQTYSFTLSGALRWYHSTSCEGGGGRTAVLHDGSVYVRDFAAFAPTALAEANGSTQQGFSSDPAPAFSGNLMVTVSSEKLHVTNLATHKVLWSRTDAAYVSAPLIVNGLVVEGDSAGVVHLLDANSGQQVWHASAGAPIAAPDEMNPNALTGLAEGDGVLAVPAGNLLTVFGRPTITMTGGPKEGSIVGPSATFSFQAEPAGSPVTCALDNAPATPCTSPYTVSGLRAGSHRVTVTNRADSSSATSVDVVADVTPPVAGVRPMAPFSTGWSVTPSWTAADAGSGVASYDVRYREAPANGAFGSYVQPASLQATTATSFVATPGQGRTVCTSVRARDRVGNLGNWSPDVCQADLLDDRAFTASGSWYRPSGLVGYAAGTVSATTARGAYLSLTTEATRQIELVGTTCPSCGRVSVSLPGVTTIVVNMQAASVERRVFALPAFAAPHSGRLTLTAIDAGKPIYLDAVGVRHD